MAWALVTGAKGGRRSAAMQDLAGRLVAAGVQVGGFIEQLREEEPGRKLIQLVRLATGEQQVLGRTGEVRDEAAQQAVCSLVFDSAVFTRARGWVEEDAQRARVLLLDGLGRLELRGQGHRPAIMHALASAALTVLSVRDEHLFDAMETLGLGEPVAFLNTDDGDSARAAFAAQLVQAATHGQR
jgi:nucleoside-triphosphatase THEP1